MSPKMYLVLAIACCLGAVLAFGLFISYMITGDFLDDFSVTGLITRIFIFLGLATVFMTLALIFFIKSSARGSSIRNVPTKTCPSCGQTMDTKEMSCPRCFTLQPVHDPRRDRK